MLSLLFTIVPFADKKNGLDLIPIWYCNCIRGKKVSISGLAYIYHINMT